MNKPHDERHNRALPQAMWVQQITRQNEQTISLFLDGSLTAQPGQFVMAWLPGVGEKPFSLAGVDPLRLTVVNVGLFSQALHGLQVGDRLWVRGPLGNGYQVKSKEKAVLVGGGYGAAPLLFLCKELYKVKCDITVLLGAKDSNAVILQDEFLDCGAAVQITTEDGSQGLRGLVTDGLTAHLAEHQADWVYACGPANMLQAVARVCKDAKVPCQLSWEALMRCGMGLCGSCELDEKYGEPAGWLVCLDGPVSHRE